MGIPVLEFITDEYERQARLVPALIILLPLVLSVAAWIPLDLEHLGSAGALLAGYAVAAVPLAQLARGPGRRKQVQLFAAWGGPPTTAWLRHRGSLNSVTRARYHQRLAELLSLALPTAEVEAADPAAADRTYESCVDYLKERTRDHAAFRLVFAENISFGFRRNLWGLKPYGVVATAVGVVVTATRLFVGWQREGQIDKVALVLGAVCVGLLVWWIAAVVPNWVRVAADAYAQRLLASTDSLMSSSSSREPAK